MRSQSTTSCLIAYAASLLTFLVLDVAWLMLFAADMFKRHVGAVLSDQPNLVAALVFYVVYAGGLSALAVWPALAAERLRSAVVQGALVGFTAYATFDLTNLAIIKGWSLGVSLVDMAWGTFASAVAAVAGYAAGTRWSGQATGTREVERP
ncbi:MAG: DUF2177 family protein [Hyphomicrobiaceae bacterium]